MVVGCEGCDGGSVVVVECERVSVLVVECNDCEGGSVVLAGSNELSPYRVVMFQLSIYN